MTDEVVNNIENHSFDGNVAVGRDLVTGGQLVARGNSIFNRNVLVEGWLTAKKFALPIKVLSLSRPTYIKMVSYQKLYLILKKVSFPMSYPTFLKVSL